MVEAAVRVQRDERPEGLVAVVTVDNRSRLNCLSTPLIVGLSEAFARLGEDAALRAVVLTGAGDRAFIGGADLNELGALEPESARLFITRLHQACRAIRDCPVPVIGRIGGFCLGAGLELAASCDFRAAADGAKLGMPEVQMGIPSVIEAALLPGLIGWGKTREMLITGALFSAAEAQAMGLVAEGCPSCRPRRGRRGMARRHLPGAAAGGTCAEGPDEPLAARLGGGRHPRRHRRPLRGLQDGGAEGGHPGVLREQEIIARGVSPRIGLRTTAAAVSGRPALSRVARGRLSPDCGSLLAPLTSATSQAPAASASSAGRGRRR